MPRVEISLPTRTDDEIDRLVEDGAFINREQAIEGLLSKGISVYDTTGEEPTELDEAVFTRAMDDQQDPAGRDDARREDRQL